MEKISSSLNEIIQCLVATLLIGLGVAIFLACKLGTDSITVFLDGMNHTFQIPVSIVNQVASLIILILALILNKESIGINTIVGALFIGVSIELGNKLIRPISIPNQIFLVRLVLMIIAQVLLSRGYGWMQGFKHGMSYTDAFLYGICKKLKLKYMYIRFLFDASFFLIGVLLGGVVGIGTIFSISTSGIMISFFKNTIIHIKERYHYAFISNKF